MTSHECHTNRFKTNIPSFSNDFTLSRAVRLPVDQAVIAVLQKAESASTVAPHPHRCGDVTALEITSATRVAFTIKWTGKTGLSSNPSADWWVPTSTWTTPKTVDILVFVSPQIYILKAHEVCWLFWLTGQKRCLIKRSAILRQSYSLSTSLDVD